MSAVRNRTTADTELRNLILETSRQKFFKFGFNAVTTEEIASTLGISKKTLYRFFPSKDKLVRDVILATLSEIELQFKGIIFDETDSVEKLQNALSFLALKLSRFERPFVRDVQRSAPNLWREIQRFRREKVVKRFGALIREGVRDGLFRSDIDHELLMLIFTNLIDSVMNPEVVSELPYSVRQVFETVMRLFLAGILTDEARKKYRELQDPDTGTGGEEH